MGDTLPAHESDLQRRFFARDLGRHVPWGGMRFGALRYVPSAPPMSGYGLIQFNTNQYKTYIYVFFAGHGLAAPEGKAYLIPFDGRPELEVLDRTALLQSEFFEEIAAAKPRSVTVFLDTQIEIAAGHSATVVSTRGATRCSRACLSASPRGLAASASVRTSCRGERAWPVVTNETKLSTPPRGRGRLQKGWSLTGRDLTYSLSAAHRSEHFMVLSCRLRG